MTVNSGDRSRWESSGWEDDAKEWLKQVSADFIKQLGAGANLSISKLKSNSEDEQLQFGQSSHIDNNHVINNNRDNGETSLHSQVNRESSVPATAENANTPSKGVAITKLELWEKFRASPKDLYECFVLAPKIQAYTRQSADISPQVNREFSLLQGIIQDIVIGTQG